MVSVNQFQSKYKSDVEMDIGLLEQSITRVDGNAEDTLAESLRLAQFAEEIGYSRIWVSEHHDSEAIAGSSPEVLLSAIGGATNTIRLGSGGIMLPHYSAFKVAENFAVLSNLYPGRIELGVGRAPGADFKTAIALATDGKPKFERFPELVLELIEALDNPEHSPRVSPPPILPLPIWILGSSPDSALLAAELGLPYGIALFINPQFDPHIIELYKKRFKPSSRCPKPRVMLSTQIFAADTEDKAAALSKAASLSFIRFVTRQGSPGTISVEQALKYPFSAEENAFVEQISAGRIIGTLDQVQAKTSELIKLYQVDEMLAVCNAYDFKDRTRSFEIFANAMGVNGKGETLANNAAA